MKIREDKIIPRIYFACVDFAPLTSAVASKLRAAPRLSSDALVSSLVSGVAPAVNKSVRVWFMIASRIFWKKKQFIVERRRARENGFEKYQKNSDPTGNSKNSVYTG